MNKNGLVPLTAIVAAVVVCWSVAASGPPDIYVSSPDTASIFSAGFSVPPPETPSGPSTGKVGQKLTYSTKGSDPLGVHDYMFDWGDGTPTGWDSNDTQSHTYKKAGTFKIRAKEKCPADVFVTDWSDPKTVTIYPNTSPSTSTAGLSRSTILLGSSACLSVRVSGSAGTPTGRVNFEVSKVGGFGWTTYHAGVLLVRGRATSKYYRPSTAGDFRLRAYYRGSGKYACSRSAAQGLRVKASVKTTTLLSHSAITLGHTVRDTAKVTSASLTPTGSITFQVRKDSDVGWTQFGKSVYLYHSAATSASYMPMTPGEYYFRALYNGDKYHTPSRSAYNAENLTVGKADSTTTTQLSATAISLGDYVTDTATVVRQLAGNFPDPTGTVDFQVSANSGATWTTFDAGESLAGGTATSTSYSPASEGMFLFRAVYNGDSNYKTSQSGNLAEPLTVESIP